MQQGHNYSTEASSPHYTCRPEVLNLFYALPDDLPPPDGFPPPLFEEAPVAGGVGLCLSGLAPASPMPMIPATATPPAIKYGVGRPPPARQQMRQI